MKIDIITLFPEMFSGPFSESIIKRAQEKGLVEINVHNLRRWAIDDRGTVDDRPYGGGAGMVLRPEPIASALQTLKCKVQSAKCKVREEKTILFSAAGKLYNQEKAKELSQFSHLILICGHYEGVDQRVADHFVDEELSIGDYVLTGGEIPAMVIVDSVVRLLPGVLEKEALQEESFSFTVKTAVNHLEGGKNRGGKKAVKTPRTVTKATSLGSSEVKENESSILLEYPHYTRPPNFRGHRVPKVLLSGNHTEIAKWRLEQAIARTKKNRPDLLL